MPHARNSLILIALIACFGCGKSKPQIPSEPVTTPEDGGQAGNGFESSWTDAYAATAPRTAPATTQPSPLPNRTSTAQTAPAATRPPATSQPTSVPASSTRSPIGKSYFTSPLNVSRLAPQLEPKVVRVSMTKRDGTVVQGGGVVVTSDGVALTTASLIHDAVAGEVEFCNQQKTRVLGHFARSEADANELVGILLETHGFELEAIPLSPLLSRQPTTVKIGDPLLFFDERGFPFAASQSSIVSAANQIRTAAGESTQYILLDLHADADVTQAGSPLFDREGKLVALTVASAITGSLKAIPVNEIAGKLPSFRTTSVTRYSGTPGATPPPQPTRALASPEKMTDDKDAPPSATITLATGATAVPSNWVTRDGRPAVQVPRYEPVDQSQRFLRFAMSRSGRWAALIMTGGKVYVYDLQTQKLAATIAAPAGEFMDCAFYHQEDKLITIRESQGITDRTVAVYDLEKMDEAKAYFPMIQPHRIAIAPNDQFFVIANKAGVAMTFFTADFPFVYHQASGAEPVAVGNGDLNAIAVDRSNQFFALGFANGKACVATVVGGGPRKVSECDAHPGSAVLGLNFSEDGRYLLSSGADGQIRFWEQWRTKFVDEEFRLEEPNIQIRNVAIGYYGRLAIGAADQAGAILWDIQGKRVLDRFNAGQPAVQVELSESAGKFAIVRGDGSFEIWPIKGPGA